MIVADIYRDIPCTGCGRTHVFYDTSVVRHPPAGLYSFTCPVTLMIVEVRFQRAPEVVSILPDDAIPVEWVRG